MTSSRVERVKVQQGFENSVDAKHRTLTKDLIVDNLYAF